MTDQQHPITPSPELVEQWIPAKWQFTANTFTTVLMRIANNAYTLGWDQRGTINETQLQERADEELAACCLLLDDGEHAASYGFHNGDSLRAARRPNPLTLKEQALEQLGCIQTDLNKFGMGISTDTIRRALEALPND
jgi:hypothetical protein